MNIGYNLYLESAESSSFAFKNKQNYWLENI
jgi:hypothetical protein